ncbi:sarcosine oxidase subunit gamma [Shimia biformata]|uniref:sarcosine oxidase subunit gamma n=1 Tax=Shimia biformata TaxID=1294299 RepID=UPI001951CC86|nr:sarcosine oxidase subunit gamma family protein [Shimia biformata]
MSDLKSALPGARFDGFATVEETGLRGMVTLRGDLSSKVLAKAVKAAVGAGMPQSGQVSRGDKGLVAWMSPDELLLVVAHDLAGDIVVALNDALKGEHALAVNVSDARAVFRIAGDHAAEVLAKLAPVDLSDAAFPPGSFRRTRLAQIPAAFWRNEDGSFELVCFRSVADYAFGILSKSAMKGSRVGVL